MVTFRSNNNNNNRRPPFRSNNNRRPPFRTNNEGSKFSNNDNFRRNVPARNNHNASKLIEKYNDLAREALANEDKIFQKITFNMPITSLEFKMSKKVLEWQELTLPQPQL